MEAAENMEHDFKREGSAHVQDPDSQSHAWVTCHTVVTQAIVECFDRKEGRRIGHSIGLSENPTVLEQQIRVLPDFARRSRHSGKFPLIVLDAEAAVATPFCEVPRCGHSLLIATDSGPAMWEWACAIRWRGALPRPAHLPYLRCYVTADTHPLFQEPEELQKKLLCIMTYEHYTIAHPHASETSEVPAAMPSIDMPTSDESDHGSNVDDEEHVAVYDDSDSESESLNEDESASESESSNYSDHYGDFLESDEEEDDEYIFEQHFGSPPSEQNLPPLTEDKKLQIVGQLPKFMRTILVGASIHAAEQNFEMALSTDLVDLPTLPKGGNMPLSMCLEGDPSPSRAYIATTLVNRGCPIGDGVRAGCSGDSSFVFFLTKPARIGGMTSATGRPVNDDDKALVQFLIDHGDGEEFNNQLSELFERAAKTNIRRFRPDTIRFESGHEVVDSNTHGGWYSGIKGATAVNVPASLFSKLSHITVLSLAKNSLTTLPEALFDLTSLEELDLSFNCLFALSPRIRNLTRLEALHLQDNCLEGLPDEIGLMDNLKTMTVSSNPITNPPSSVWTRGLDAIRQFFKDGFTHGMRPNTDLKVLVVGLSEAGKTSLINGLTERNSRLMRRGDRTVGIETRTFSFTRDGGKPDVNLLIHDFAGQQEYYASHHIFLSERALYIIAFDLSKYSKASFGRQIDFWFSAIQDRVPGSKDCKTKVMVVGTHADMIEPATAQRRCEHAQSALNNKRRNILSELNRKIKSAKKSIGQYNKQKDNIAAEQLAATCGIPPEKIMGMVKSSKEAESAGSNKDAVDTFYELRKHIKLTSENESDYAALQASISQWNVQTERLLDVPTTVYAVSSADELRGMNEFFEGIVDAVQDRTSFPQLDENIPTTYFSVRKLIRAKRLDPTYQFMRTNTYLSTFARELTNGDGSQLTEDEVERATLFMHDLGECFYDKNTAPNVVFLKVGYLVDAMKFIIRHDHAEATLFSSALNANLPTHLTMTEDQFYRAKRYLLHGGRLDIKFLRRLWAPPPPDGLGLLANDETKFDAMVKIMEQFEIAATVDADTMVVPEFLMPSLPQNVWPDFPKKTDMQIERLFQFVREPPRGLVARLQVRLSRWLERFSFSQNELLGERDGCSIRCCLQKGSDVTPSLSPALRVTVRSELIAPTWNVIDTLVSTIESLLESWPGLQYESYAVAADDSFFPMGQLKILHKSDAPTVSMKNAAGKLVSFSVDSLLGPSDATPKRTENDKKAQRRDDTFAGKEVTESKWIPLDAEVVMQEADIKRRRLSFGELNLDDALVDASAISAIDLLQSELGCGNEEAESYLTQLRSQFGIGTDADDLLTLTDADLKPVMTVKHRRIILKWIEKRVRGI